MPNALPPLLSVAARKRGMADIIATWQSVRRLETFPMYAFGATPSRLPGCLFDVGLCEVRSLEEQCPAFYFGGSVGAAIREV